MLRQDTTFIIGAGASWDFDFPLGDGLRDQISNILSFQDPDTSLHFSDERVSWLLLDRAKQDAGGSWPDRMEAYRRAAAIIRNGLNYARSIDTFLDGLRDEPHVEFLGKVAIATAILRAEAKSPLSPQKIQAANWMKIRNEKLTRIKSSWHAQLGQILYEGHTRETIGSVFERATFVVFNYDRCIEEFLTISLMNRFAIDRHLALSIVATCRIIHPYGKVGNFLPEEAGHVPFGAGDKIDVLTVAEGIKTFTEAMEASIGDEVKESIARADTLVFMGFGWLPQNMDLLQAPERRTGARRVFATTMNMPQGEVDVVAGQLDRMLCRNGYTPGHVGGTLPSPKLINEQGDCKALMTNCWLRLTSG